MADSRDLRTLLGRVRAVCRATPASQAADILAVCVVAHLATLPVLVASGLGQGPWALPANIAVAPAVPLVTVLGTAAATLGPVWEGGAVLLAAACAPALWWLETVADIAAGLPGSPPVMPG